MFNRREKEPTTDDATNSIASWEMLDETQIAAQTTRLQNCLTLALEYYEKAAHHGHRAAKARPMDFA